MPISPLYDWHLPPHITPRAIQNLMRMSVIIRCPAMIMRSVKVDSVVRVHVSHFSVSFVSSILSSQYTLGQNCVGVSV
jgi:hypothetical protein